MINRWSCCNNYKRYFCTFKFYTKKSLAYLENKKIKIAKFIINCFSTILFLLQLYLILYFWYDLMSQLIPCLCLGDISPRLHFVDRRLPRIHQAIIRIVLWHSLAFFNKTTYYGRSLRACLWYQLRICWYIITAEANFY